MGLGDHGRSVSGAEGDGGEAALGEAYEVGEGVVLGARVRGGLAAGEDDLLGVTSACDPSARSSFNATAQALSWL